MLRSSAIPACTRLAVLLLAQSCGAVFAAPGAAPAYPPKIGPTGRYLVDQKDRPFLIAGESPQAMMAYLPEKQTITVDMTKLKGPAAARWYDPSSGKYQEIAGSPLMNAGSHKFTSPGDNADGAGNPDWVLVLETDRR